MTVDPLSDDEIKKVREILPIAVVLAQNVNLSHQIVGRQERFGQELSELRHEMANDRAETAKRQMELHSVRSMIEELARQAGSDRDHVDRQLTRLSDGQKKLIEKVDSLLMDPSAIKVSDVREIAFQALGALVVAVLLGYAVMIGMPIR